jgi:hypothetical protein
MTLVNNTNNCGYHIFEVHRMMCLCWVHTCDIVGFVLVIGVTSRVTKTLILFIKTLIRNLIKWLTPL